MSRWMQLFRRRRLNAELSQEVQAHIEERADELMEGGMSREQALSAARAQFGNRTLLLEESRAVWSFTVIENLLRDLRIGARTLGQNPLFTAVAVTTLALGIGANAAIFSLIHAVLLQPMPFPDARRIVALWEVPPKRVNAPDIGASKSHNPVSPINFLDWRARTHSFEAMAAISPFPIGLSGFGEPREVDSLMVSADFFRILGVAPMMGRTFTAAEDVPGGPKVAVLSYGLWQQQFGGDAHVVGRTVRLLDEPYAIIGVMPKGYDLPFQHGEIWAPAQLGRDEGRFLSVIAKLKPGIGMAEAQADLNGVAGEIAHERPFNSRDWTTRIVSLYNETTGKVRTALLLLFGAVIFVLLIAAANVANLLLMRGAQRGREMAVRTALGASRGRIASQLLAESFLLSAGGGLLGIALAWLALHSIAASLPALALPRVDGVGLDAAVVAYSAAVCLITTFLFGLGPAITFSRNDPGDALRQAGSRTTASAGQRMRGLLVVAEVALSIVLLTGAALMARSFLNQTGVNRGFRVDHILTMRMFFAPARYHDVGVRSRYLEDVLSRVRVLPGVEAASSVHFLPMTGATSGSCFTRADRPEPAPGLQPAAEFLIVSPGYFTVMGTPVLSGRDFNAHDTPGSETGIVVNEAFARRFFPSESPLGKQLHLCWNVKQGTIVGVVANARQLDLTSAPNPTIFLDQAQTPMYFSALVVRSGLPPSSIAQAVQAVIHSVDPDQAISHVESMEQVVGESIARPRVESVLLAVFAGMALVLAMVGLYGVLAYLVTQQTREIGIRMALGAASSRIVGDIVRDGLALILCGIAAGLLAALALTRFIGSLLYDVRPTDPPTFIAVCLGLLLVGLFASWLPARRAAAVDPIKSLRWE